MKYVGRYTFRRTWNRPERTPNPMSWLLRLLLVCHPCRHNLTTSNHIGPIETADRNEDRTGGSNVDIISDGRFDAIPNCAQSP